MATVDLPRTDKNPAPKRRTGRSRAFKWGSLAMLCVLLLGTYFAPAIVANTSLGQWLLASALKLDGTISFGSASLGWFSSVVVEDVQLRDSAGDAVLDVAWLATDKSLSGLLLDLTEIGAVHAEGVTVHVVAYEKDSNLERLFASLLATSPNAIGLDLDVTEGVIVVDDTVHNRRFQLDQLKVQCSLTRLQHATTVSVTGNLQDRVEGKFKVDLNAKASADGASPLANGKIDCQTSGLPMELVAPIARRYVERADFGGRLSTQLSGAWGDMAQKGETSVSGEAIVSALVFSAAALGDDQIQIERVEMPCNIVQNGDTIQIEELGIHCELGQLTVSGSAKMSDLEATDVRAALMRESYDIKGQIDLARLAKLLPTTLQIREGTEITAGQVSLAVSSRPKADGATWSGRVAATSLSANNDGHAVTWQHPLSVDFVSHETGGSLVLEKVHCASDFLQVDGAGSLDDLTATAKFDLARLMTELKQFSDLGGVQLAGSGQADVSWKRLEGDAFTSQGTFQAKGFQFIAAQNRVWKEDAVLATLAINGTLEGNKVKRVDRASVNVEAGSERLQAQLRLAVTDPASAALPIDCSWHGQLAHWTSRLQVFVDMAGWDFGGTGSVQAAVKYSAKGVEIEQAKADFAQFHAHGPGWIVDEPALSGTLDGVYDREKSRLEIEQGRLAAGSTSVATDHLVAQRTADGWSVSGGTAQLAAELATLYRWKHDPRTQPAWQIGGKLHGDANLKYASGATSGTLNATVDDLQVVDLSPPAPGTTASAWRERQIKLTGTGTYTPASNQLKLERIAIGSSALALDAGGALSLADEGGDVNFKGTVAYDWQQLAPLMQPYVGGHLQVTGRQTRAFNVAGKLTGPATDANSWRQITGDGAIGWTGMTVYGMQVGPSDITAHLADGQVRTAPIDIQISEGHLTTTGYVRLSPGPVELLVPRGPLLNDIHLTPEICSKGLKYVAPILSDTTVADGRFSISMDGGHIPLADPGAGDTSGKMAMRAQVKAGPVGQEFMVLIRELTSLLKTGQLPSLGDQSRALLSIDETNIEFRLMNRRVYHRGLKFTAGTTPITTYGSVGLDETLALVAEIPIQATFLGRDLSLGALEGQTLKINIDGTLTKPRIDKRILQQFTGKLLENATRGVLINEVNKQFDKLFPLQP